jgi:hypothetical protein
MTLLGRSELVSNLLVALTLGDAGNDCQFFGRKMRLFALAGQRSCVRAIGLDDSIDGLVVDPGLPGSDLAHALDQQIG